MEKYNWKEDPELRVWLLDSAPAPKAIKAPKFDSLYKFVIHRNQDVEIKKFVPEWALPIVSKMLDRDTSVRDYYYEMTYKGNVH